MNILDRLAYDSGGYTVQEILSSFCKKLLEIIDLVNKNEEVCDEAHTLIENIRNEVVPDLVDDIMKEMQDNNYFDNLVNVTLIEQLRTELTTLLNDAITDYTSKLNTKVNNYHIRSSSDNPNADTTNLCFGSIHNMIADDLEGCVISGGGTNELWANVIGGNCDAVWQGDSNAEKQPNVIDGKPTLGTNAKMSVITGGYDNVCNGLASMITGHHNYIREKATHAVISGGTRNKLDAGNYTGIGAGVNNRIAGDTSSDSSKSSVYSYICGGLDNTINNSSNSFIGSGQRCTIENKNHTSVITGGVNNVLKNTNGYNQKGNFIGGGLNNVIDNSSNAVICGGEGNSIDGRESVILGGSYNKALCGNATVFGKETVATRNGEIIYSNGKFAEVGDNNVSQFTLKETTTDGNYKILLASLKDNTSVSYTIKLHATNINDLTETCYFEIKGVVVKQNGTVTRVGTDVITKYGATIKDTWETYGVASNQGLLIRIIGEDGKTIRWLAKYEFTEIGV